MLPTMREHAEQPVFWGNIPVFRITCWTNGRQTMTIDAAVDRTKDEIPCDLKTFLNGFY